MKIWKQWIGSMRPLCAHRVGRGLRGIAPMDVEVEGFV